MAYELRTFQDIYNAVMEELKIQSSDTTSLNRIKRDINMIYLDEVVPYTPWYWLRKKIDVVHRRYFTTGTATVTNDSTSVTLTNAPSDNKTGCLFKLNGYNEVYKIRLHSGTSITLDSVFTGTSGSAQAFKIWDDGIALPVEIDETYKVWHDHKKEALEATNDKDFLDLVLNNSDQEGRPDYYRVTEAEDPIDYETIASLPALSTRASSGQVKTLVFASTVASYLSAGDFIEISLAGNESYNGDFIIESVSTTTVTYIGDDSLTESATADATLVVKLKNQENALKAYRKLMVYPFLDDEDTTIHVEGIKRVSALNNDSDEPVIPLRDRIVLMYGALHKAWSRLRNPEEASRNFQLFERKLSRMAAKIQDSTDCAQLKMSKLYLRGRRLNKRRYTYYSF